MEIANKIFSNKYSVYGAAFLSGLLAFLSDFPNPIPWLAWIAPVPVLVAAIYRGFPNAYFLGIIYIIPAFMGSMLINLPFFMPMFVRISLFLFVVIIFSLVFFLTIYLIHRLGIYLAPWINAFAVIAFAFSLQDLPNLGHGLALASAQFNLPLVRSIASIGGDNLIVFSLYLFSGSLAAIILDRSKKTLFSSGFAFILIIAFMLWGSATLERNKDPEKLKVAAIAINFNKEILGRVWDIKKVQSADTWIVFDEYEKLSRLAASQGASIISWPEYGLWVLPEDIDLFKSKVKTLAVETKSVISAGYIDIKNKENNLLLAGPDGEKEIYSKHHLVLGGESLWQKAGEKPFGLIKINKLAVIVASRICFDNDFRLENRDASLMGADIFLAPSSDDIDMAEMHGASHALLATENGIPLIRPTLTGRTIIVDYDGTIIAESKKYQPGSVNMIVGEVTINKKSTPYRIAGNWIVYVSIIGVLLMIAFSSFKKDHRIA